MLCFQSQLDATFSLRDHQKEYTLFVSKTLLDKLSASIEHTLDGKSTQNPMLFSIGPVLG